MVKVLVRDKMHVHRRAPAGEPNSDDVTSQDRPQGYSTNVVQRNTSREKKHNIHLREEKEPKQTESVGGEQLQQRLLALR